MKKNKRRLFCLLIYVVGMFIFPQINKAEVLEESYERFPEEFSKDEYIEVSNFEELKAAIRLEKNSYIKIMNDFDNYTGTGSGTIGLESNNNVNYKGKDRVTKVIDGKISDGVGGYRNAQVNFRQYLFWFYGNTPVSVYSQNLDVFSINWYGWVSGNLSPKSAEIKIYNHNIHHVGSQMMRSDNQDVFFSGNVQTDVVKEYTFNNIKNTPIANQGNLQSSNVTFAKNAKFIATSEYDGQLQVLNSGKVTLGENAYVFLDTADGGGFTPSDPSLTEQPPSLHVEDGNVILEKNAILSIESGPTRKEAAIFLEGKNSSIVLGEGSQLNVKVVGNNTSGSGIGKRGTIPIQLNDDTSLIVGENAFFKVSSTATGTGTSPTMKVGSRAKFEVKRKGSFVMETDGTGKKTILDMGAKSEFRFTDAQSVDIKFLNQDVHKNSSLIDMSNPGNFYVDVQSVHTWTKGNDINSFTAPNYKGYSPMFGMVIPYNGANVNNSNIVAASTSETIVNEFKTNFNTATGTTGGFQRILYEFIDDVDLTINSVATDDIKKEGSTTISGTATPGSYLRLSTKPVLGSSRPSEINPANNAIKSPVTMTMFNQQFDKMTPNFTLIVPSSGKYSYTLPSGTFNAGTEIEAYAFKEGKTAEVKQDVLDETPPTGESNIYLEVEGEPVPPASVFVKNASDTNPLTQNFKYEYVTNIDHLMTQIGTHDVQVYIYDNAGNRGVVNSQLIIYEATKENVIEASDFKVTQKELSKVTNLEEFIIEESEAEAYKIVNHRKEDFTNQIKVTEYDGLSTSSKKGKFIVTLSVPNQDMITQIEIEVIPSEVEMKVKQVYKGTNHLIYGDLDSKTPVKIVDSTETIGEPISNAIDKLETAGKLSLEKTGYLQDGSFIVKVNDVVIETTDVPDEDFEIIFEYVGQMYFDEVPNLDFGQIEISNKKDLYALDSNKKSDVKIVNTIQDKNWQLKLMLPDGIKNSANETYLGDLIYYDDIGTPIIINQTAAEIVTQDSDDLLSILDMKGKNKSGMRLSQKIGNTKTKYSGQLVWSVEDVARP